LAKLEETHGARIHDRDDDRLVTLAKRCERMDLDWCWLQRYGQIIVDQLSTLI